MIQIIKTDPPEDLVKRGKNQTELDFVAYKKNQKKYDSGELIFLANPDIYNSDDVREVLEISHHRKCCFCETKDSRSFTDVEHFRPKGAYREKLGGVRKYPGYFWLAYEWQNLFYACAVCNQIFKNDFFPIRNEKQRAQLNKLSIEKELPELVHPFDDNPEKEIGYRESIPYGISDKGEMTISLLGFGTVDNNKLYTKKQKARIVKLVEDRLEYYNLIKLVYEVSEDISNTQRTKAINIIQEAQHESSKWSSMIKSAVKNKFKEF